MVSYLIDEIWSWREECAAEFLEIDEYSRNLVEWTFGVPPQKPLLNRSFDVAYHIDPEGAKKFLIELIGEKEANRYLDEMLGDRWLQ